MAPTRSTVFCSSAMVGTSKASPSSTWDSGTGRAEGRAGKTVLIARPPSFLLIRTIGNSGVEMDEERAGFGQAHLETQPGEVPLNGLADRGAHLVERLACHLHIADARNERAAFQIGRRAQLEVLRTPEIQLEDVARTADVAVGI